MSINITRLKDLREDNDLTQEEMAKIVGGKRSAYSLWELGITLIPIRYVSMIADHYKCSMDYLLSLTDEYCYKGINNKFDESVLGDNIKNIRKKHKLTQRMLASFLGVTQACVAKYEKGEIEMNTKLVIKFAKSFSTSLDKLCGKIR